MHIHDHSHGEGQPHQCGDAPSHGHSLQDHSHDRDDSHAHGLGGHAGHAHPPMQPSVLAWAMAATLGLVVAEIFGGLLGHSIALLNDAVHNLSDLPALGISWLAMRWAQRPADDEKTYGYRRAGELAAFTNAVLLVLLAVWLGWESIERLRAPQSVVESWMIWTSIAALAVNGGITLALVRGRNDLNLRSILVHNFGDALSNVAIILGAIVIGYTGWHWIDPLLGLAIGLLVLWSSIGILRASAHVLLEGRPKEMRIEEVARAILRVDGVMEVHDVHIWSLGGGEIALSCHARVPDMHLDKCETILAGVKELLKAEFSIGHVTVQLERAGLPAQSGYVMPEPAKR
jgi:cobalt-zinc-cadmium efflux system protein